MDFIKLSSFWKIESNCVQDDTYSLNNLISNDNDKRKVGFMPYLGRPPLAIKLECEFKINLKLLKVIFN